MERRDAVASPQPLGTPVELNVYDLLHPDNPDTVPTINWYLYGLGMGLYHSGVSVFGTEYCYGGHPDNHTGVFEVRPRKAPDARFRQTLLIGRTSLTMEQVGEVVGAMSLLWTGNSYNLLTRYVPNFSPGIVVRCEGVALVAYKERGFGSELCSKPTF